MGTLKFSVYIGEADFFGVKILNFHIFGGFSEKLVIFLGSELFMNIFFGVMPFLNYVFGVIYNSK